jgi:hypothetical protein
MADEGEVRARQILVLSTASWRLLNCFDELLGTVHVTDEVLPHLTRREVDALVAHDLGRHWRQHGWSRWTGPSLLSGPAVAGVAVCFGMVMLSSLAFATPAIDFGRWWPVLLAAAVGTTLYRKGYRRERFAARNDRDAVELTGDPEALITALAKLRRLDLLPFTAGSAREARKNGPAWRRLENIADRFEIPPDRLEEILAGPGTGEGHYPPLPPPAMGQPGAPDPRVFSQAFKVQAANRAGWALLIVSTLILASTAWGAARAELTGWDLTGGYLGGWLAAMSVTAVLRTGLSIRTHRMLAAGVRRKLEAEGITPAAWNGLYVGLSPGPHVRIFNLYYDWDVGFLVLAGDRLCYLGDQVRFQLRRTLVRSVRLGPAPPGLSNQPRVLVEWLDEERHIGGTLQLGAGREGWWRDPQRRPSLLLRRLQEWLAATAPADEAPPALAALPLAEPIAAVGKPPRAVVTASVLKTVLILRGVLGVGAAATLGIPFGVEAGAPGWFVVLAAMAEGVRPLIPLWLYRDREGPVAPVDPVPKDR